ncbi:MAG: hypothetical protein QOG21_1509 [Actinomycetota bacterium]|jgi:uncharacterized OsmC-like protein|nr:hypothetical protein [Actinomycetota bacterium]
MQRKPADKAELRAAQQPLKDHYRRDPDSALGTLKAEAKLDDGVSALVGSHAGLVTAGLHPATGGDGLEACSGDMLLQALAACAGVTLLAVSTSMNIPVHAGAVRVEGDLDWRGTLGVSRDTPVGFSEIRVAYELDTDASDEQLDKLLELTERYCVVYQTLAHSPSLSVSRTRLEGTA